MNKQEHDNTNFVDDNYAGTLKFDPVVPREKMQPIFDAFEKHNKSYGICLVESFLRPRLDYEGAQYLGQVAIIQHIEHLADPTKTADSPHINTRPWAE